MMGKCEKGCPQKLEVWPPKLKYDILVKCWTLKNEKAQFRGCCVDNPVRMKGVINCSAFKTIMQDLRRQLEEQWKHKMHVLVVCLDGHGSHRAFTMAAILKAYYEKRGFDSHGPCLATSAGWRMKYCYLKECELTKQETEKMYAALGDEW